MTTLGLNAAFTAGTNLLGIRNDPYFAFNFLVEIEGLVSWGFTEVTGLQVETEVEDYREGGRNGTLPINCLARRGIRRTSSANMV